MTGQEKGDLLIQVSV